MFVHAELSRHLSFTLGSPDALLSETGNSYTTGGKRLFSAGPPSSIIVCTSLCVADILCVCSFCAEEEMIRG